MKAVIVRFGLSGIIFLAIATMIQAAQDPFTYFYQSIRLAAVIAGTLVMTIWAVHRPAPAIRIRIFRFGWALVGAMMVVSLLPGLYLRTGPISPSEGWAWAIGATLGYSALTTAAIAQSSSCEKSVFGASVLLLCAFLGAGIG